MMAPPMGRRRWAPYENNNKNNVRTRVEHQRRRRKGICVNNMTHGPAFKGGRCELCWVKKIDAELVGGDGKMRVRARWIGPLPDLGHFLRSPIRPRFVYAIVGITETGKVGDTTFAKFEIERLPLDQLPEEAIVHDWKWDVRTRKKGRRAA